MDVKTPLIGGSALADPFYTIKDVLEGDVRVLRGKFDEWQVRHGDGVKKQQQHCCDNK